MNFFQQLFSNKVFLAACFAWIAAQAVKVLIYSLLHKHFDWHRCFGMGGMPSSHSAFVVATMITAGLKDGFDSAAFGVAFVIAAVVIYDALGVRRETGKQGKALNEIVQELLSDGKDISDNAMKELVGHTPLEVLCGVLVGCAVAAIVAFI